SKSKVPSPCRCSSPATSRLRGLWRELPLPCTNTTRPRGCAGSSSLPSRTTCAIGILTSRVVVTALLEECSTAGLRFRSRLVRAACPWGKGGRRERSVLGGNGRPFTGDSHRVHAARRASGHIARALQRIATRHAARFAKRPTPHDVAVRILVPFPVLPRSYR